MSRLCHHSGHHWRVGPQQSDCAAVILMHVVSFLADRFAVVIRHNVVCLSVCYASHCSWTIQPIRKSVWTSEHETNPAILGTRRDNFQPPTMTLALKLPTTQIPTQYKEEFIRYVTLRVVDHAYVTRMQIAYRYYFNQSNFPTQYDRLSHQQLRSLSLVQLA